MSSLILLLYPASHSRGKPRGIRPYRLRLINLKDISRLPEAIGLFLREHGVNGVNISVHTHELEKIACLSGFSASYGLDCSDQFAILDHARFAGALVTLKATQTRPREGSFVFEVEVEDEALGLASRTRIFAGSGGAGAVAEKTGMGTEPVLKMSGTEAVRFLCYPVAAMRREVRESEFLRDILPLPVSWETADGV